MSAASDASVELRAALDELLVANRRLAGASLALTQATARVNAAMSDLAVADPVLLELVHTAVEVVLADAC